MCSHSMAIFSLPAQASFVDGFTGVVDHTLGICGGELVTPLQSRASMYVDRIPSPRSNHSHSRIGSGDCNGCLVDALIG